MKKVISDIGCILWEVFADFEVTLDYKKRKQREEGSIIYDGELKAYRKSTIKDLTGGKIHN